MIPNIASTTENIQYAIDMTKKYGGRQTAAMVIKDMMDAMRLHGTSSHLNDMFSILFFLEKLPDQTRRDINPNHQLQLDELYSMA